MSGFSFWAEITSSCYHNIVCDVLYNKSEKNVCQYCFMMCLYGNILHLSNVHNIMGFWSRHIIKLDIASCKTDMGCLKCSFWIILNLWSKSFSLHVFLPSEKHYNFTYICFIKHYITWQIMLHPFYVECSKGVYCILDILSR